MNEDVHHLIDENVQRLIDQGLVRIRRETCFLTCLQGADWTGSTARMFLAHLREHLLRADALIPGPELSGEEPLFASRLVREIEALHATIKEMNDFLEQWNASAVRRAAAAAMRQVPPKEG